MCAHVACVHDLAVSVFLERNFLIKRAACWVVHARREDWKGWGRDCSRNSGCLLATDKCGDRFRTNWLQIWSANDPEWVEANKESLAASEVRGKRRRGWKPGASE